MKKQKPPKVKRVTVDLEGTYRSEKGKKVTGELEVSVDGGRELPFKLETDELAEIRRVSDLQRGVQGIVADASRQNREWWERVIKKYGIKGDERLTVDFLSGEMQRKK